MRRFRVNMHRFVEFVRSRMIRRVIDRGALGSGRLSRRLVTVVSVDLDPVAGVGAVWLVWWPMLVKARSHRVVLERCGAEWQETGRAVDWVDPPGFMSSAERSRMLGVIETSYGSGGCLSLADRQEVVRLIAGTDREIPLGPDGSVSWVGGSEIRVAAGVDHLLVGERRVEVPAHGCVMVAWKVPWNGNRGLRPDIVAVGHDGKELSRLGPRDVMDSATWATMNDGLLATE